MTDLAQWKWSPLRRVAEQFRDERDRARDIAVALEQRLARVDGLIERLSDHARDDDRGVAVLNLSVAQSSLRAALEADQ